MKKFGFAFSAAFGLAAVLLLSASLWQYREARHRAAHWQAVDAAVSNCRIAKEQVSDPGQPGKNDRLVTRFFAEFELDYEFNGLHVRQWHRGATGSSNRSASEVVLGRFGTGSHHTIWVNPEHPEEFLLQVSGWESYLFAWICGGLGVIFALAGSALFFYLSYPPPAPSRFPSVLAA